MITYPHCKINIGLHVVRRRHDGYHDIETVFFPVHDIHDELEITPSPTGQPIMRQMGLALDNSPSDNLCMYAWEMLHQMYGIPAVDICLKKNIPFGAGLGGGSSDAVATLRMLDEMFSLDLDANTLHGLAVRLGADCPFFLLDGPAYATGIGDHLEPLNLDLSAFSIEIKIPAGEHVSTREAYGGLVIDNIERPDLRQLLSQPVDLWPTQVVNDFEKSVFLNHPAIAELKNDMYQRGAVYASMTGSGAAVYGLFVK